MPLMKLALLVLTIISVFFTPLAIADHEGPERAVEGKYRIILTLAPRETASDLQFFFRDAVTGKSVVEPLVMDVVIRGSDSQAVLFQESDILVTDGVGELSYQFPTNGLYDVEIEFALVSNSTKVYKPEAWTLWAPGPGLEGRVNYPIGGSVVAGFSLLAILIGVVGFNLWQKRKQKL